jgi:hypothetical protein
MLVRTRAVNRHQPPFRNEMRDTTMQHCGCLDHAEQCRPAGSEVCSAHTVVTVFGKNWMTAHCHGQLPRCACHAPPEARVNKPVGPPSCMLTKALKRSVSGLAVESCLAGLESGHRPVGSGGSVVGVVDAAGNGSSDAGGLEVHIGHIGSGGSDYPAANSAVSAA